MKQRFKNSLPRHKDRIKQFWQVPNQMKKQNTNHKFSFLSPTVRTNHNSQQIQKTKTLKKHNYFGSQNVEANKRSKSQQSCFSNVLEQLASYVQQKNGQIPWTKKYNWQEILVSSGKKSIGREDQIIQQKKDCQQKDRVWEKKYKIERTQNNNRQKSQYKQRCNEKNQKQRNYFSSYTHDDENYQQFIQKSYQKQPRNNNTNTYQQQKQQQKKQLRNKQQQQQQQWQCHSSDTESIVDFLLKINKISQTQTFSKQQKHESKKNNSSQFYEDKIYIKNVSDQSHNQNHNDSDSDDFDQLMIMVERQQKRRKQKSQQLKRQEQQKLKAQKQKQKQDIHLHQYQYNSNNLIQLQQTDSPIIVRRRQRNFIDDFQQQSPLNKNTYINHDSRSSSTIMKSKKLAKKFCILSSQEDSQKQEYVEMQKNKKNGKYKDKQNNNKNNRSSQYKPCRLKKQRYQQTNCTICMCEIEQRAKLPCHHQFCLQCLKDWLQKTSSCPICRKDAKYYKHRDEKYKVEQKKYSLQNYVDNIGDDDDSNEDSQQQVDYQCQNCQQTNIGDEIIICDRCLVNASHVDCDRALGGVMPPDQMNWYCSVCRQAPMLWFLEIRRER